MIWLFDPLWLIMMAPGVLLGIWAQAKVKSAYSKWSHVRSSRGMSGMQVARLILQDQGLYDVGTDLTPGQLSDHYDPTRKVVRLSEGVGQGTSVASISVAAHEVGHALQHRDGYLPMRVRSMLYPAVAFASGAWQFILIAGLIAGFLLRSPIGGPLIEIAILLFGAVVVFQFVTLPVEFNASRRALAILNDRGIVTTREEADGARAMLSAAAWTYVAGALTALLQLLYLLIRFGGGRD